MQPAATGVAVLSCRSPHSIAKGQPRTITIERRQKLHDDHRSGGSVGFHRSPRYHGRLLTIETGFNLKDINNLGQAAVGGAVFWQNGNATPLGSLFGPDEFSDATAISDAGHIIGISARYATGETRGFLVTPEDTDGDGLPDRWYQDDDGDQLNDLMLDLGLVSPVTARPISDVNSFGQVVGQAFNDAFVWFNGVMTNLGPGFVHAINDRGQVVGGNRSGAFLINPEDTDADGVPDRWYRDDDNNGENDLMRIIEGGWGVDVNEHGQVLVQLQDYAVLWTPGTPNGTSGSEIFFDHYPLIPIALNDTGQAVVWTYSDFSSQGLLWENGRFVDIILDPPLPNGAELAEFYAVNNSGWIIANGGNLLIPASIPRTHFARSAWPRNRRSGHGIAQAATDTACVRTKKGPLEAAAGEAYRQASSSPARHLSRRSVCAHTGDDVLIITQTAVDYERTVTMSTIQKVPKSSSLIFSLNLGGTRGVRFAHEPADFLPVYVGPNAVSSDPFGTAVNGAGVAIGNNGGNFCNDEGCRLLTRGFRWNASGTTILGGLDADPNGFSYSRANSVNDAGTVVGSAIKYDSAGNQAGQRGAVGAWDEYSYGTSKSRPWFRWLHSKHRLCDQCGRHGRRKVNNKRRISCSPVGRFRDRSH